MSTPNTLVWTTIDYDKPGKQVGWRCQTKVA